MNYKNENAFISPMMWPSNSPDLNFVKKITTSNMVVKLGESVQINALAVYNVQ